MFLFPLTYFLTFLKTIKGFLEHKANALLIFLCVGLPLYMHALSVTHMLGWKKAVPFLQGCKEIVVFIALGMIAYSLKKKPKLTLTDKLVGLFLVGSTFYAFIPLGTYSLTEKMMALKSVSFFTLLYAIGRFISIKEIALGKIVALIAGVTLAAGIVVLGEYVLYEHIHAHTGFANFLEDVFGATREGHYDLLWSFEIESGAKRFGSIFSNPLDYSAALVLSLAICLGYYTSANGKFSWNNRSTTFLAACSIGILLALSRASFIGFFLIIYLYALITKNTFLRKSFYLFFLSIGLYLIYFLSQHDVYDFIMDTLTFSNASSIGHVLEWIQGIEAMSTNPFGLGLGESGRVSAFSNNNTGGENQFIITGVQLGIPLLLVYIGIHISLIKTAWTNIKAYMGKLRRLALGLFLFKIGFLIPMFTANTESYIYLSYLSWFLSGYMVNLSQRASISEGQLQQQHQQ